MALKTECTISIYEIQGKDAPVGTPPLKVESHWNHRSLVVLSVQDTRFTVSADDLQAAIKRCRGELF